MDKRLLAAGLVGGLMVAGLFADGTVDRGIFTVRVEALVGHPLTPISVAGVARRTTRRMIRRTAVFVATLPVGCSVVVIDGISLHQCGTTYYQPYNNQYVVVVIE